MFLLETRRKCLPGGPGVPKQQKRICKEQTCTHPGLGWRSAVGWMVQCCGSTVGPPSVFFPLDLWGGLTIGLQGWHPLGRTNSSAFSRLAPKTTLSALWCCLQPQNLLFNDWSRISSTAGASSRWDCCWLSQKTPQGLWVLGNECDDEEHDSHWPERCRARLFPCSKEHPDLSDREFVHYLKEARYLGSFLFIYLFPPYINMEGKHCRWNGAWKLI